MLGIAGEARTAPPPALVCKLPRDSNQLLPPTARHGLINHLPQYPTVSRATPLQRARASASLPGSWRPPRGETGETSATQRERATTYEPGVERTATRACSSSTRSATRNRAAGRSSTFDGQGADLRERARTPLVLVGAMWSTRDGEVGPTPAGPILRWHSHVVCKEGKKRGLKPPASGKCPPRRRDSRRARARCCTSGSQATCGARSRSAAPRPELCAAGLLPGVHCRRR